MCRGGIMRVEEGPGGMGGIFARPGGILDGDDEDGGFYVGGGVAVGGRIGWAGCE